MGNRKNAARANRTKRRRSKPAPKTGWWFLEAILEAIEAIPEAQTLISVIATRRRNTRPGYSARNMLRAVCCKYLLNEPYVVGLVERFRGSERLRDLCGFGAVPSQSTFSRFFKFLSEHPEEAEGLRTSMVNELHRRLPELGRVIAIDGTDIESFANPTRELISDPDAAWGRRTRKSKHKSAGDEDTEPYFGYKMVSIADVTYGVPLLHILVPANRNESPLLREVVRLTRETFKWFDPEYVIADRGYDAQRNHEFLNDLGIKPIIHIRKPVAEDGLHDGIFSTLGIPTCDGETKMEYLWTDPVTGEHLYRCPSKGCKLQERSSGAVRYCDTVEHWEDPQDNLRVISIVARAGREWKDQYRKRTSIERYFASAKQSRLLNSSRYLSKTKIIAHTGMSEMTYLATMLARLAHDHIDNLRQMRLNVA